MSIFHKDWKAYPYWWDTAPLEPAEDALPQSADVVIVGSGYSGLSAALTLARAGLAVAVLEAGEPGQAASTRNHGMVSGGQKLPADIDARFGYETARAIEQDAKSSFEFHTRSRVATESLDADYAREGRFNAAHTRKAFQGLARRTEELRNLSDTMPRWCQGNVREPRSEATIMLAECCCTTPGGSIPPNCTARCGVGSPKLAAGSLARRASKR